MDAVDFIKEAKRLQIRHGVTHLTDEELDHFVGDACACLFGRLRSGSKVESAFDAVNHFCLQWSDTFATVQRRMRIRAQIADAKLFEEIRTRYPGLKV